MTDYEELVCTHNIKERLGGNIEKLTEVREDICSLDSYRLHGRLSFITQDLQEILKILELESGMTEQVQDK